MADDERRHSGPPTRAERCIRQLVDIAERALSPGIDNQVPLRLRRMLDDIEGVAMERYLPAVRQARAVVDANSEPDPA